MGELTELQLAILGVLWERGEATVREVHSALEPATGLARATIGTLLHRLHRQGILNHRPDGREYLYRAAVRREAVQAAFVSGLVAGPFEGSVASMVSFALSKEELSRGDLAQIRELLDRHAAGEREP